MIYQPSYKLTVYVSISCMIRFSNRWNESLSDLIATRETLDFNVSIVLVKLKLKFINIDSNFFILIFHNLGLYVVPFL